eukprot:9702528-Ditylum_brightwellii.AAC.1
MMFSLGSSNLDVNSIIYIRGENRKDACMSKGFHCMMDHNNFPQMKKMNKLEQGNVFQKSFNNDCAK